MTCDARDRASVASTGGTTRERLAELGTARVWHRMRDVGVVSS
jgi:hypothetical protein